VHAVRPGRSPLWGRARFIVDASAWPDVISVGGWPHIEISETDNEVKLLAELPGMEQNDIELTLTEGMLTLKGEKKSESGGAYSERWHGQFERTVQLGPDVDQYQGLEYEVREVVKPVKDCGPVAQPQSRPITPWPLELVSDGNTLLMPDIGASGFAPSLAA
jgi:Hsp20/alpha crystallin family